MLLHRMQSVRSGSGWDETREATAVKWEGGREQDIKGCRFLDFKALPPINNIG
jgi:hypothetical protein